MPLIFKRPRTTQPTGRPLVGGGSSLTRGLVLAVTVVNGRFYDSITGQFAVPTGTFFNRQGALASKAPALFSVGSASAVAAAKFANPVGTDYLTTNFTLFCEGSLQVNASTQDIFKSWESGAGAGVGLSFDDNSLVLNGFFGRVDNATPAANASTSGILGANSESAIHRIAFSSDGVNKYTYANGALDRAMASTVSATASVNRRTYIHSGFDPTTSQSGSAVSLLLAWDRPLSSFEYKVLHLNPWQVFKNDKVFYVDTAAGGSAVNGAFSWTEQDDTASISSTVKVTASTSWTEANDTCAINANALAVSSIAWTEDNDVISITGTVGSVVTASLAWTEENDSCALAASVKANAVIGWTEASDVMTIAATSIVNASAVWTEQDDIAGITVTVAVPVSCAMSWTEENDSTVIYASSSAINSSVYGSGHPTREDVERHWELIALRDKEEARKLAATNAVASEQIQAPQSQPVPIAKSIVAPWVAPSILATSPALLAPDKNLVEQQRIDAIAKIKKQNEEALILILMEM